jgi:hypothetical protein
MSGDDNKEPVVKTNDGGLAFPGSRMEQGTSPEAEAIGGHWEVQHPGMTLRDYFAAKAMQGAIHHRGFATVDDNRNMDAKDAYAYADAMIRARGEA